MSNRKIKRILYGIVSKSFFEKCESSFCFSLLSWAVAVISSQGLLMGTGQRKQNEPPQSTLSRPHANINSTHPKKLEKTSKKTRCPCHHAFQLESSMRSSHAEKYDDFDSNSKHDLTGLSFCDEISPHLFGTFSALYEFDKEEMSSFTSFHMFLFTSILFHV